jgi:hypothetical protein
MVIVSLEKPIIANLNSYYLDVRKLLEHCQGELGAGGIQFKSSSAEAAIFFDNDALLNAIFQEKGDALTGRRAVDRLLGAVTDHNFAVNIYKLDRETVYYFANVPHAKKIYRNLSTDFTDLEGLIKKMGSEKLTGYIEASIGDGTETGVVFFRKGGIIGASYSWGKGETNGSRESQEHLIEKTRQSGGTFNVSRIPLTRSEIEGDLAGKDPKSPPNAVTPVEELLIRFETLVTADRRSKRDFHTLLKKKFLEKAEKYAFLDPFAAEFEYFDRKITFSGVAANKDLAAGVMESVKELAEELGLGERFENELIAWSDKYAKELMTMGIHP